MSIKQLLLLYLVFLTGFAVTSLAQEEDPFVCGSAEKFKETKRWHDLPGCIELNAADYDHPARIILSRAKKEYRDFFSEWTRGGEHALSGAVSSYESGIKKIYQNDNWDSDPGLTAAKPSYDEMKRISEGHLAVKDSYPLISELSDTVGTLDSFSISLIQREGKDPDATLFALKNANAAMIKVVAAGLPDWLIIRYSWKSKSLQSLGEVKADLESTGSVVNKLARSTKAADEAKWKPYTDVLKGDRLKLFNKYEVGTLQGVGGRMLRTPADFRTAPFYAKYTNGTSGILNRWNMTIWRFRGDKIIATETRSGWGDDPPSSAFR
jgi:hypothetical protein